MHGLPCARVGAKLRVPLFNLDYKAAPTPLAVHQSADFGPVSVITGEKATFLLASTSADIEQDWNSAMRWGWTEGFKFAHDNGDAPR